MPALINKNGGIFSSTELGELYHIAHSKAAKTENVARSLSKTLPAQISLKGNPNFDVILGKNVHHGSTTAIGLTTIERERHIYIIGGTGNGKTTMMLYGMVQDLKNGKGFAFVDPHGDAAEEVLRHVPEDRVENVIYFNPDDLSHPIGLNLLEIPEGLSGDDLLREKDRVTEATISVFRKIFSDDGTGGHRIEYVLRNTIQTALTMEGATLFTIFRLLNDDDYRKTIVDKLTDEDLKNFWENELGKAGDFQRVKMSAGITAKVGRFLFSASAKRILEQPRSTIDFDDILASGKVLVCNFSKGLLGEDTSELFGITVLAKLQMAALRRARIGAANRRPYYLYVDEFQNFATMSFVQMLSEARKYKLFLTMAEQSTSQQDDQQMVNIIFANVGTVVCFRTGNPADEKYLLPLFSPYIQAGEIANLPAFNFYARLSAVSSQEPTSGETIVLVEVGDEVIADRVRETSRAKYAIRYVDGVEAKGTAKAMPDANPKRGALPKNTGARKRKSAAAV
ncbi:TraM recognition domain-containing protein [bacterium]|nr:MAG: TraM recognition domain-containing protein [bacterium]